MKTQKRLFIKTVKNEQGFVLVLSLMVLVVLTLLGIQASKTSVTEITITGNDNLAKMLLYYAESAAYETAQRLENIQGENEDCPLYPNCLMFDQQTPAPPWLSDPDDAADIDSLLEELKKQTVDTAESRISVPNNTGITVDMVALNNGIMRGESMKIGEGDDLPKAVLFQIIGRASREVNGNRIEKFVEIGYRKNF